MCCLLVAVAFFGPRFALFLMWLFGDRLSMVFDSFLAGFAGWLLLPFTTLTYALAYAPVRGVEGIGWFFVAFGFLLDMSTWFGGGRSGADRYAH